MTRAIADTLFGHDAFWDFVYQAVVVGLGVAATLVVYFEIAGL
jgi:hypothetical protein